MGSCNSKEAEVSAKQKKLNADLDRIEKDKEAERQRALDDETIPLNINGPDGNFDVDARLNGTLHELTEKVVLKLGLTKEYAKDVEMHLSGYKLEPVTKIVREFTELCAVILGWCQFEGVTECLIAGLGDSLGRDRGSQGGHEEAAASGRGKLCCTG